MTAPRVTLEKAKETLDDELRELRRAFVAESQLALDVYAGAILKELSRICPGLDVKTLPGMQKKSG